MSWLIQSGVCGYVARGSGSSSRSRCSSTAEALRHLRSISGQLTFLILVEKTSKMQWMIFCLGSSAAFITVRPVSVIDTIFARRSFGSGSLTTSLSSSSPSIASVTVRGAKPSAAAISVERCGPSAWREGRETCCAQVIRLHPSCIPVHQAAT